MNRDSAPVSGNSEVQAQIHYKLIESLSESERRYRALVERLRDPILQCDVDGRLEYLNRAWTDLTGHARDASVGRNLLEFLDPAHVPCLRKALTVAAAAGAGPAVTGEFRLRMASGEYVDVGFSLGQGSEERIVGSLHDLQSQKETERSLERARDAAEEANRLKSSFLANMSHEIRTPLSAVLGYAELLTHGEVDPSERRDYADRIQRNGKHLLALVNDILDFSRIESGQLGVHPEPFALCELIDDLEAEHSSVARDKGLSFATEWSAELPPGHLLLSDRTRLRQVLTNLLSNATKFTLEGGVTLRIESAPGRDRLRFTVADSGIGIAHQKIETLFQPFRQADETITRRFGGTGLGLAISARLAELLDGFLSVDSEPDVGSTFVLEIPLSTVQGHAPRGKPDRVEAEFPALGPSDACRVLVVEDTTDLRTLMVRFCEDLGLEVHTAANGAEALERVGEVDVPYKAILMDMQMPVMDGYTAVRALRGQGYSGLVVAMTAYAMRGDREKCLEAGCDDYLAKPVTRASLRGLFERYCQPKP